VRVYEARGKEMGGIKWGVRRGRRNEQGGRMGIADLRRPGDNRRSRKEKTTV